MAQPVPPSNTSALPPPRELLPATTNPHLLAMGSLSLYNSILLLTSAALLQHFIVFGLGALLRGFSRNRLLDLHYITFLFALSLAVGPAVFLLDLKLDQIKVLFFIQHFAIEAMICTRVLLPTQLVKTRSGPILFALWTALFCITAVVVLDQFHHKSAMIVVFLSPISDASTAVSGLVLVLRWMRSTNKSAFGRERIRVEGLAGIGFMVHGIVTVCIAPIFTCVIYAKLHPDWYAYAWAMVWSSAYFTIGFCIPAVGFWFSNLNWCCGRRRRVLPGEAGWQDAWAVEDGGRSARRSASHSPAMACDEALEFKEPFH